MQESMITSRQNERVKNAVKLRSRRERERQSRFLVDGSREITRAAQAGVAFTEAFVCETLCTSAESQQARNLLQDSGADVAIVTKEVFAKLAFGEREEGIVAVGRIPTNSLDDLMLKEDSLVCVVEGIEKPGNLGAILRSADAAGVAALIATGAGTDVWNSNTIRASLGTVFSVPVCCTSSTEAIAWLQAGGCKIFAALVGDGVVYSDADYSGRSAIVVGSEASGLSDLWLGDQVQAIHLPMLGAADSLNVSATASVLFYEAWRQRAERK